MNFNLIALLLHLHLGNRTDHLQCTFNTLIPAESTRKAYLAQRSRSEGDIPAIPFAHNLHDFLQ